MADLRRRLRELQRLITETIVDNDALYLEGGNVNLPLTTQESVVVLPARVTGRTWNLPTGFLAHAAAAGRFDFVTQPEKVRAFLAWLTGVMDDLILAGYDPARQAIPNRFLMRAIAQAAQRADNELIRAGIIPASVVRAGGILTPDAIPASLARTAQILFTRNYAALEGLTADIGREIARELSSGVLAGINPRDMAKTLTGVIEQRGIVRANIIARTEVVNAYAETSLDRYEQWGVQEVTAMVEFSSAGDDRMCSRCDMLNGSTYTTEDARGVIPVHPQCRCTWLPISYSRRKELMGEA